MYSCAQEKIDMVKMLNIKEDIVLLENRITNLIKKSKIAEMQGLKQFHVFCLFGGYNINNEEKYKDDSFLNYLKLSDYYVLSNKTKFRKKNKEKYLKTFTYITDSTGNFVARGDAISIYVPFILCQEYNDFSKMFYDNEIDFAFCMGQLGRYFIIKDNEIYVIKFSKEELKIYTLSEYVNCCFEEWMYNERKYKTSIGHI